MNNIDFELLDAQHQIHSLVAQQAPLERTLDAIARWLEILCPGAVIAFMQFDPVSQTLSLLPSIRFSWRYVERLQSIPVGPDMGSFGAAAYHRRLIVTEDIQADPCWYPFCHDALTENLHACWSQPVIASHGELLGTFGTYYRHPYAPTDFHKQLLHQAAALVALALIRDREGQQFLTLSEWHRSLFENHPDGVCEFDLEGHFLRSNKALEIITGRSRQRLEGHHFNEFVDPAYRELTQAAFDAAKAGDSRKYETFAKHADGHIQPLEVLNFPVRVNGAIVGVYGICHDITARKRQEAELRLLQRGIEASPVGVLIADAHDSNFPTVYANDSFYRITGYTPAYILGKNCRILQGEDTDPETIKTIKSALKTYDPVQVTLLNYRKDNTPFWNRLSISPVFDEPGHCTHFIGTLEDVTHQRNQEAKIAYQATHDMLTGLPNQAELETRLAKQFVMSQQHGLLALMYLDLDHFRDINESLGHHIGNQLLIKVSHRLSNILRPDDTLARVTSDEFVLLLPGFKHRSEIAKVAERVIKVFDSPIQVGDYALYITASVGVACTGNNVCQAHTLLRQADLAMAEAKRQGRNTWQWYHSSISEGSTAHMLLRHEMQAALKNYQFELFYQPIVESFSGRIHSIEALIRWHHPKYGMISPAVFIPLAEKTGQIITLGRWVLWQACHSLASRRARGERIFPVAVNISSLQFLRDGFIDEVTAVLKETGLPPEYLELEITESVLLRGPRQAVEIINELRKTGITVTLDDFGTGFSSLSYLRDLPIHKVKLDRSFIQDILISPRTAAIVQSVITMAHHLEIQVVAEGVEEHGQWSDLGRRHCDFLQGYLFAKPMPLIELQDLPDILPKQDGRAL